jgi:hypothetical protein
MAQAGKHQRRLSDGYSFPGFRARSTVRGVFGDPNVRIVTLERRSKKRSAIAAGKSVLVGTTDGCGVYAILHAPGIALCWRSRYGAWHAARAVP